jgi:hypothetical protein
MSKRQIGKQSPQRAEDVAKGPVTIGIDLRDKFSRYCVLDKAAIPKLWCSVHCWASIRSAHKTRYRDNRLPAK